MATGPVVFEVAGEIDGRHPAMTELPLDVVSVGKSGGKAAQRIRHPERFLCGGRCGDVQEDIQMQTACQRPARASATIVVRARLVSRLPLRLG